MMMRVFKMSASWDTHTLSHVNLVLQDGGIISPSSSDEDDDLQSNPAPKRLMSVAIRPPPRQTTEEVNPILPSSTRKNLTVKELVKSSHSVPDTSPQVLPWSEFPNSSLHCAREHQEINHAHCHGHGHGHSHSGDEHVSPSVNHGNIPCEASQPHGGSPALQDASSHHAEQESHGHPM